MLIQSLSRKFNNKTSAGVALIGSRAWSEANSSATKTGSEIFGATAFSSYEISRGLFLSPSVGYVDGATEANLLSSTHIKVDQDTSAWTGSVALTQVIPFGSVVFGSVSLSTSVTHTKTEKRDNITDAKSAKHDWSHRYGAKFGLAYRVTDSVTLAAALSPYHSSARKGSPSITLQGELGASYRLSERYTISGSIKRTEGQDKPASSFSLSLKTRF